MNYRFLLRRGLAAAIRLLNEIVLDGEIEWAKDARNFKVGDGTTHFNDLPWILPMWADAGGTADALTATFLAQPVAFDGMEIRVRALLSNTGPATIDVDDGQGAIDITKYGGTPLAAGDILAGQELWLVYQDQTSPAWELANPGTSAGGGGGASEGTWAARPSTPTDGQVYLLTDAPSQAIWDANTAEWHHRIGTRVVVPPVLANFSQVNWGTSSTAAFGPFTSIIAQVGAAYALRVLDKAAPSTPYTVEMGVLIPLLVSNTSGLRILFGAGFREASSGKMHLSWFDGSASPLLHRSLKMNSATSASASYGDKQLHVMPVGLIMFRFRDDGVNRYIDVDMDGAWLNIHSVGRTDFLTADRICIAINLQDATYFDRVHWVHHKEY